MDDLIVKFIYSTNEYMMMFFEGCEGTLTIGEMAILKKDGKRVFKTSWLKSVQMEDDELVLETLNNVYRFKVLAGSLRPEQIITVQRNQDIVERFQKFNEVEKSILFVCMVGGTPDIDGKSAIVKLPFPMRRKEALEYISENIVLSTSGDIVVYIQHPLAQEKLMY